MKTAERCAAGALVTAVLVLALGTDVSNRAADNWPQWRGVNRDGHSPEKGLLKSWPEGGPPMAWKASGVGEGYSSFAIADGKLFTLGARGDREFVVALDVNTGK